MVLQVAATGRRPPRQQRRADARRGGAASFEDSAARRAPTGRRGCTPTCVDAGWKVSEKTVADSMARQGLVARRNASASNGLTRPDKAGADPGPGQAGLHRGRGEPQWCGDLTEIPTERRAKLYL